MEEIKIGDIVTPNTPVRHKQLGIGIVTAVKQSDRCPVTVVFPSKTMTFVPFNFKETKLKVVKPNKAKLQEVLRAERIYMDMYGMLNKA